MGHFWNPWPVQPLAAGIEFLDAPIAIFGLLLVAGALVAGIARRSFLSLAAAFVVAGLILGQGGLGALELDPGSDFVQGLAVIALVLILFRDGLEVETEMLQTAWHLPFRKLVLAMPLTAALVALAPTPSPTWPGPNPFSSERCPRPPIPCSPPRSSPTRACPG
jgi:hypothetical protein